MVLEVPVGASGRRSVAAVFYKAIVVVDLLHDALRGAADEVGVYL
jgi:hypothetical protein